MSITSDANSTFLEVDNAHLRVSGDIHATSVKVGAIEILPGYSLESTTVIGNTTSQTIQFTNTETSLVTSGDINMLHSSNNAAIKLNSNVVTEFPRSKKLIKYPRVALTSAAGESSGYQGYYVTESSNSTNTNRHSWKAFDMTFATDTSDNGWANGIDDYSGSGNTYQGSSNLGTGAVDGEWIKLQLPHKIRLEYMKIWLKDNDPTRIPDSWILYGSDDNTNWTKLLSKTGQGAVHENTYNVNANSMYNYLGVVVTKISGQPNYFRIMELEFFGVPEYDPEAHGTDVVVKSVPNVPNTDWLEVYYDAKDLADGSVTSVDDLTPSGTTDGTATNVTVSDGAFVFNGTNSRISSSITQDAGAYVHTATLWYYTNDDPATLSEDYIYQLGGGSTNTSPSIQISINRIYVSFMGNYIYTTASNHIQTKKWVQISYAYDGGPVTLSNPAVYINGTRITMTSGPLGSQAGNTLSLGANPQLRIGCSSSNGGVVNGKIANFRLFNRALSQDEIYQLYAYQKEYFGHGDLSMTLKAGRLGIGTSEPRAALDVRGDIIGGCPVLFDCTASATTNSGSYANWDRVKLNKGGGLNGTAFTAPVEGHYFFHVHGMGLWVFTGNEQRLVLEWHKNGVHYGINEELDAQMYDGRNDVDADAHHMHVSGSIIAYLEIGDTIQVIVDSNSNTGLHGKYNRFTGHYIG